MAEMTPNSAPPPDQALLPEQLDLLFRQVVDATPHVMLLVDPGGRIRMANAHIETVFGYTPETVLGRGVDILVPDQLRFGHPAHRAAFQANPRPGQMTSARDLHARRADGEELAVDVRLTPIQTQAGPMVLATIIDISEREREAKRLREALREQAILVGEVHHRVHNNLQIIYSLLDLQSSRIADPVALTLVRDSQNRIRSMALIHQVLYQSKEFAKVDFAAFIQSLLSGMTETHHREGRDIAIRVDAEPVRLPIGAAVPCGLMANELIVNAFRHAFAGRARGTIDIALAQRDEHEAVLSVADDGVGLPEEAEIPDRLGLRMVQLLSSQLKGTLEIQRANPTKFTIRFPI